MQRKSDSPVMMAYEDLKERIITFKLLPNTQLSDHKLAQELGVSRASVREAILLLGMDGLVDTNDANKIVVAPIGLPDVLDIMNVRCALESEAIRIIAGNGWLSAEKEKELRQIQDAMDEHVANKNFREQYNYDDLFHRTIVEASGSPRIILFLERMRLQMQRARWLNVTMPQRQVEAVEEHEAFLKVFLNHDLEGSLHLMREHLTKSADMFKAMMTDQDMQTFILMIKNFYQYE